MPEDSKKNQDKKKNDPKEQRKPRNARNQANKVEKRTEKVEESKPAPKVTVPQKPPVYQDPGPEFYKNLKRETEEILKITEEENSKYKKKEIQSNWSKYEMPIETYDELEDHDIGADYEKLIQAPLSIGGHFQFKHEKSWDVNTGPSLYDKYFEINMDNLSLAVSTVPFYERNSVDISLFSETDILSMNNRATKYKQKYYDDKSFSTPETEAQDRILNSLKESLIKNQVDTEKVKSNPVEEMTENIEEERSAQKDDIDLSSKNKINVNINNKTKTEDIPSPLQSNKEVNVIEYKCLDTTDISIINKDDDIDELLSKDIPKKGHGMPEKPIEIVKSSINLTQPDTKKFNEAITMPTVSTNETKVKDPEATKKNPVIESPEDLEKWLDDFLDG